MFIPMQKLRIIFGAGTVPDFIKGTSLRLSGKGNQFEWQLSSESAPVVYKSLLHSATESEKDKNSHAAENYDTHQLPYSYNSGKGWELLLQ